MIFSAMLLIQAMQSSYAQGHETFDNIDTSSSTRYKTRTWTANDGSIWTATNSRTNGADINGTAVGLNDDTSNTYIESGTISNGIGSVTLTFKQFFSGSDSGTLTIYVNNTQIGTVSYNGDENSPATTSTIHNINIVGDFVLRIANETGGSDNGGDNRIAIDDIIWTSYSSSAPTVAFESNSSTTIETDTSFNINIPVSMTNFDSNVTVNLSVHEDSSVENSDYQLNTTSLTFTNNGSKNVSLTINDDNDIENEVIILNLTISSGTADISRSRHTINIQDDDQALIINEIHADPDSSNGDANGDGIINTADDEFIEIFNTSGTDLNISFWTLEDLTKVRHTFPNGTVVPKEESIVLFGSGTPITVPGLVQMASSGGLGLNNSGDTITIKNANGDLVLVESYPSAGNNQSIARNDDINGNFVDHSEISTNPVLFSPGRDNTSNTSFSSAIKWTGITDNDWNNVNNWLDNSIPISTSNVIIPKNLNNYPTLSTPVTINSINMESGTSLISNSEVIGTIHYKRNLPTTNWYLVSSPVSGQTIENLISNHSFTFGTGTNIGIAPYFNDGTSWNYQTISSTGSLAIGQGISVKLNSRGTISFTGNLNTEDVSYPITQNISNFNLVGNPFTSYINSATFTATNRTLLTEETIWLWNGNQYETFNTVSPLELAPAQGFFVEAATDGNLTFTNSNQSHQANDTFLRSQDISHPTFKLFIEKEGKQKSTKVFYVDGKTTGFDNGYDSKRFSEDSSDLAVFTQLVSDSEGQELAIQTLPNNNFESNVIPIGLKAKEGEVIFSLESLNFPTGIEIILEDRINEVYTNLTKENYSIFLDTTTNGIGQFYIHTIRNVLDIKPILPLQHVDIYLSTNNSITITGLHSEKASLNIYSIIGKKVMNFDFSSNGNSTITIPKISSGVYLVQIDSSKGKICKKIAIK